MMELEMIFAHDRHELPLPDMVTLYQLLVQRGWVWKMPAPYQAQAVAFISMGLIDPEKKGKIVEPKITIVTKKEYWMLSFEMRKEPLPPTEVQNSQSMREIDPVMRILDKLWQAHNQSLSDETKTIWRHKIEAYKRKVNLR